MVFPPSRRCDLDIISRYLRFSVYSGGHKLASIRKEKKYCKVKQINKNVKSEKRNREMCKKKYLNLVTSFQMHQQILNSPYFEQYSSVFITFVELYNETVCLIDSLKCKCIEFGIIGLRLYTNLITIASQSNYFGFCASDTGLLPVVINSTESCREIHVGGRRNEDIFDQVDMESKG